MMFHSPEYEDFVARRARLGMPVAKPVVRVPPPPKPQPVLEAPKPYNVEKKTDWLLIRSPMIDNSGVKVGAVIKSSSFIIHFTARAYGVTVNAVKGTGRTKMVSRARHEICYRLANELGYSVTKIGRLLHKDHSSVIWGIQRHELRIKDPNIDDRQGAEQ